jgi:hypothetical protein
MVKYMTKDATQLANALPCVRNALTVLQEKGSDAPDKGTARRSGMFFLTRVLNNLAGRQEVSASMAAGTLLNVPVTMSSHQFWWCFARPLQASMCAMLDRGDGAESSEEDGEEEDEGSVDWSDDEGMGDGDAGSTAGGDASDGDGEAVEAQWEDSEDEVSVEAECVADEEGGDEGRVADAEADEAGGWVADDDTVGVFDGVNGAGRAAGGGAVELRVERDDAGGVAKVIKLGQHIYYEHRGSALANMSPYEFAGLITVAPKPRPPAAGAGVVWRVAWRAPVSRLDGQQPTALASPSA